MLNFIRRLPPDSELSREISGMSPEDASWTRTHHLLAIVADRLAESNWMFASANSDGESPERPEPIPRPGADSAELTASSVADQAAFFMS